MKACTDCRYHDDSWGNNCANTDLHKPDPVQGVVMTTCDDARDVDGKCGPDARLFEKRRGFLSQLFAA